MQVHLIHSTIHSVQVMDDSGKKPLKTDVKWKGRLVKSDVYDHTFMPGGKIHEVPDEVGKAWIKSGIARLPDSPKTDGEFIADTIHDPNAAEEIA